MGEKSGPLAARIICVDLRPSAVECLQQCLCSALCSFALRTPCLCGEFDLTHDNRFEEALRLGQ
jgi:hypothetical protein